VACHPQARRPRGVPWTEKSTDANSRHQGWGRTSAPRWTRCGVVQTTPCAVGSTQADRRHAGACSWAGIR